MGSGATKITVEIDNRTTNDITKLDVASDKPSPLHIDCIPAGKSHNFQLIPEKSKTIITAKFLDGTQDSFAIFLNSNGNGSVEIEKTIETHRISVQPLEQNTKIRSIRVTFENTQRQIENHEAQKLCRTAKDFIVAQKFSQASAKLDEALKKANETQTITDILAVAVSA